jgi:parallel beta-helix repeat protein
MDPAPLQRNPMGRGVMLRRTVGAVLAAAALVLAVGPGAQAAKPVSVRCGDTIIVDTKLANDLTDCPGNGIIIGADRVTLDLNGHAIDGDGVPVEACPEDESCDVGVVNSASDDGHAFNRPGHNGVTIKNGSVEEFWEDGVYALMVRDNRVRDLTVSDNGHGVTWVGSADSRIEHTRARGNLLGLVVASCPDAHPVCGGIRSRDIRIEHSSVSENEFGGIIVGKADRVRVSRNSVSGTSDGEGIVVRDGSRHEIEHNSLSGNAAGLGILNSDHILVTRNAVLDNRFVGAYLVDGDDSRIDQNAFVGNSDGLGGLYLEQSEPSERNVISSNALIGNDGDGILIEPDQGQNLIKRNLANGNTDDGIDVDSPTTTLTGNTATHNHDLGIEAVPGVTDAGGNKAVGNGNPLQCANVFCK